MPSLVIAQRFCGPPQSANGGYFSGMVAAQVSRPAFLAESPSMQPLSVRLEAPPPLDTDLVVVETPGGGVEIREGDRLVGGVAVGSLDVSVPSPVAYGEAVDASRNYMGFTRHRFPTCFVCGTHRTLGDGLCIYAGPVSGRNVVAAPWTADRTLDRGDGKVKPEFMWAALDCPGYYAVTPDDRMMLLAQFTAELVRPIEVGERCAVVGWRIQSNGPRHEAGTALYGGDGELRGRAWALWIEPRSTR
ncbi:MAG: hypothetical protein JSR66_29210 [Proteobacteria bacterium]|nr:hypothetical protein [Pseudomonadota bacterium]